MLCKVLLEEMNWKEVKAALESGVNTVIIVAGSIEQHGPHIAEACDALLGHAIAVKVAEELGNALVAPVIRPGLSSHHLKFPGSISLRKETFMLLVEDYVSSLASQGFKNFILFSSHGGNFEALVEVAADLAVKYRECKFVTGPTLFELVETMMKVGRELGIEEERVGFHAGEAETSKMLAEYPHLVMTENFEPGFLGKLTPELEEKFLREGLHEITANGVLGDPTAGAYAENGRRYIKAWVDLIVKKVKDSTLG